MRYRHVRGERRKPWAATSNGGGRRRGVHSRRLWLRLRRQEEALPQRALVSPARQGCHDHPSLIILVYHRDHHRGLSSWSPSWSPSWLSSFRDGGDIGDGDDAPPCGEVEVASSRAPSGAMSVSERQRSDRAGSQEYVRVSTRIHCGAGRLPWTRRPTGTGGGGGGGKGGGLTCHGERAFSVRESKMSLSAGCWVPRDRHMATDAPPGGPWLDLFSDSLS